MRFWTENGKTYIHLVRLNLFIAIILLDKVHEIQWEIKILILYLLNACSVQLILKIGCEVLSLMNDYP